MKAIVVTDNAAGTAGMKLMDRPEPQAASLASLLNRGLCGPGTIGNYLEPHPIEVNCRMLRCGPNVRNVRTLPLQVKSGRYLTLHD